MVKKAEEKRFVLEFIRVYRSLQALWDVKNKDYTNRVKKNEQYDILVEKYRENFPDAGKKEVIKKINSLRTNFRKELKRIRDAEKSGVGAKDIEPLLWYFEEMRFLKLQETPTASTSTMAIVEDSAEGIEDDDTNNTPTTSEDTVHELPKKRQKKEDLSGELISLACKRLQQSPDDYEKISAAWAVDLRKMDPQQQIFAKKAINDIIFEGLMGTLHRNSVEINATRC